MKYQLRLYLIRLFVLLAVLPVLPMASQASPVQQEILPPPHLFTETGRTVSGQFLRYWLNHGALAQQGYPISQEFAEQSAETGQVYTVQYYERAVFEQHPENDPPYDVLLSLLGTHLYQQVYPQGARGQQPNTSPGSISFPQTGKRLGGKFLRYWQEHGGLAQQGYPISEEFIEVSALDGRPYRVQYFERAVFELHPENAGTPYEVLLAQLGTLYYRARYSDADNDGVPTSMDGCPGQRETPNFIFDGDGCSDDITSFVNETAYDLNAYWQQEFASSNRRYVPPRALIPYIRPVQTGGCNWTVLGNALYCPDDHTVYYDANFLTSMVNELGDFAPAIVIAHEWGHALQRQIYEYPYAFPSPTLELQADCFAGVWSGHVGEVGGRIHLEQDDLLEGAIQMLKLGDYAFDNPGHHGTPDERAEAFINGLENGAEGCFSR